MFRTTAITLMLAIITARGGSKGLPRKNVLPFLGEPLIVHTIRVALACGRFSKVVLSTDCEEIAGIGRESGCAVPFLRPLELAGDTASSKDVVLHAIDHEETASGRGVESFCLLQPTSPLRTAEDLRDAIQLFEKTRADSVLSVCEYEHPIQWAVTLDSENRPQSACDEPGARRQDMKIYYRPNGAIYLFRTESFRKSVSYLEGDCRAYIMPPQRSVDIDTEWDFVAAEAIAARIKRLGKS